MLRDQLRGMGVEVKIRKTWRVRGAPPMPGSGSAGGPAGCGGRQRQQLAAG